MVRCTSWKHFGTIQRTDAGRYSLVATSLYFTCANEVWIRYYHTQDMLNLIRKRGLKQNKPMIKLA